MNNTVFVYTMSEAKERLDKAKNIRRAAKGKLTELLELQRFYLELNGQFRKLRMF